MQGRCGVNDLRPSTGNGMTPIRDLTGEEIRAALGYLRWTRERLAKESGISPATIYRMLAQNGPVQARRGSVQQVAQALRTAGALGSAPTPVEDPLVTVPLPIDKVATLPAPFGALRRLLAAWTVEPDYLKLWSELDRDHDKLIVTEIDEDDQLRFVHLGPATRMATLASPGAPVTKIRDPGLADAHSRRIWRCLITGEAALEYLHRTDFSLTALEVPASRAGRPVAIGLGLPGRPSF